MQHEDGTAVQQDASLKPSSYERFEGAELKSALADINTLEEELVHDFRSYRATFLHRRLHQVAQEQQLDDGEMIDPTDVYAAQLRIGTGKAICRKCAEVLNASQPTCPSCGEATREQIVSRQDLYGEAPESEKCSVKVGDPIDVMPNGYANCKAVLDKVKEQAGVGVARQWVALGCDGQPYELISKLMDMILVCD